MTPDELRRIRAICEARPAHEPYGVASVSQIGSAGMPRVACGTRALACRTETPPGLSGSATARSPWLAHWNGRTPPWRIHSHSRDRPAAWARYIRLNVPKALSTNRWPSNLCNRDQSAEICAKGTHTRLRKRLEGDIDAILLTSLQKNPSGGFAL
jgi:hypothetical protein